MIEQQKKSRSGLRGLKNLLLYAGIEREDYQRILPTIMQKNRNRVIMISGIATALIFFMLVSSNSVSGVGMNHMVYLVGFFFSLLLFLSSAFLAKRFELLVTPLMLGAYSIFYIYGILIGTITDPKNKTVTFIVMMVFLSNLFIDRPLHMMTVTSSYIVVFIVLCLKTKTGEILENDIIDALVFGLLGIASGVYNCYDRVQGYLATEIYRELGQIDQLTGLKSQNAFKAEKYSIKNACEKDLACIYLDANGLKRLNDEYGHEKGNELLSFIGEKIREYFGEELTYRFGGDEFYVFVPDPKHYELKNTTDKMIAEIEAADYSVSAGWKIHPKEQLNIDNLVIEAENWMYKKKNAYHKALDEAKSKNLTDEELKALTEAELKALTDTAH